MPINDVIIKPTTDLFIAALWSDPKNEPILRSLLNGVMTDIGQPAITEATVLNPFNIKEFPNDKEIRLDVRVKDESGTIYDVEVQTDSHPGFYNRMLYYWARTYGMQIQRGEDYKLLRPVRSIIITEFSVFPELERLHTVFEVRARENPAVLLSEHLQIHFLRLGNWNRQDSALGQLCRDLQCWLQFWAFGSELEGDQMSAMLRDVPEVQAAYDEFRRFTSDPVMREKLESRERFLTDRYLDRADALAEGRAEGRAEGEAIGRTKGRAEGEAIGRTERNLEVARNMKKKGYSIPDIADLTGLSLSEIERLD